MKILSLLLILTLCSCGQRHAEDIGAEKQIFSKKSMDAFTIEQEIDPILRDASIIIYPHKKDDLSAFEFDGKSEKWAGIFEYLDYGSRIDSVVNIDDSNSLKIEKIVNIVMSASNSSNDAYLEIPIKKKIWDDLKDKQEKILEEQPCYEYKDESGEKFCKTSPDESTSKRAKYAKRTCKNLKSFKKSFKDLNADEEESFEQSILACEEMDPEIDAALEEVSKLKKVMRDVKALVLEMLQEAKKSSGINYVNPVNDRKDNKIVFSEGNKSIEEIELTVDFGDGDQLYSMSNGKISNVNLFRQANGIIGVDLNITTRDFTLKAELSLTIQKTFEARLVGTTKSYYHDGKIRDGVMKFEMNLVK